MIFPKFENDKLIILLIGCKFEIDCIDMSITKLEAQKKSVNWGIIGCGNVTEFKSGPAFNRVPDSSLVAVMRRDAAVSYTHLTLPTILRV